jgi:hypothetical protein
LNRGWDKHLCRFCSKPFIPVSNLCPFAFWS